MYSTTNPISSVKKQIHSSFLFNHDEEHEEAKQAAPDNKNNQERSTFALLLNKQAASND